MTRYRYEAVDVRGDKKDAEIECVSEEDVLQRLYDSNLVPLRIYEARGSLYEKLKVCSLFDRGAVSEKEFSVIIQEISLMIKSGMTLEQAIEVTASIVEKESAKKYIKDVLLSLREGNSLADAIDRQKGYKPNKAYVGMVRAGEAGGSGMMERTLERLSESLAKSRAIKEAISSALIYPAVLMVMAILSVFVILVFVLPQFSSLFEGSGAAVPFSIKVLSSAGSFLGAYWMELVVFLSVVLYSTGRILKFYRVKRWVDSKILRVPMIGSMVSKAETARFCRTLGELQLNGVPLVDSLTLAAESFKNSVYIVAGDILLKQVREGKSLSSLLQKSSVFPDAMVQMVRIGEETGNLGVVLLKLSDVFDRDLQRLIQRSVSLLAPMLTIVIGGFIAGIIATVLSAILSANDVIT